MNLDRLYEYFLAQSKFEHERAKVHDRPDLFWLKHSILSDLYLVLAGATIELQIPPGQSEHFEQTLKRTADAAFIGEDE